MFRAPSHGALLGAAAGLVLALGDFGASWLWLSERLDRFELFVRLIAVEVPVGAALGVLLATIGVATNKGVRKLAARTRDEDRWERRLWPLPFALLASPAILAVAYLLFTGGMASRLPMRPALVAIATLVLLGSTYLALRIGRALVLAAPTMSRRHARMTIAAIIVLHFTFSKIDQSVLPGLYDYLHGTLTALAWLTAALAVWIIARRSPRLAALDRRTPVLGLGTVAVLAAMLAIHVFTLDFNQTVRVALLSPRASASRSVMLALGPVIVLNQSRAAAEAIDRARRARARRSGRVVNGPTLPGAHILLVTIDALRADHVGTYGYRRRRLTPEIDRIAQRSVVFELAYAQAPHSSFSLSSVMTSEYLYQRNELQLPLPSATLPTVLRDAGYHTVAFYTQGIFHTEGERLEHYRQRSFGFGQTSHLDVPAEQTTDEALLAIQHISEAGEPPSFLWVHYFDVHEPYEDDSFGTSDLDRYDGDIRITDRAVSRLVREAEARLSRPVVLVITADHGEEFRDHGGVNHGSTVYQEQIRVPFIVRVPGVAPRRVATPVELVDLAPTLLGLVGVPPASSMRGDDLRPLLTGAEADYGPVFASASYKHMVVAWPYKLIADLRFNTYELYDLQRDPTERNNIADERRDLVESLKGEVRAWLDSLADENATPYELALNRGRVGDRGASPALCDLVLDYRAATPMRSEAAQLLRKFGRLQNAPCLPTCVSSRNRDVAAECAISLGWLRDERSHSALRRLVRDPNPDRRMRAGIALGRLNDRAAVPVLIEALGNSEVHLDYHLEIVKLLGILGDRRAFEPLIEKLDDERLRRRSAIALGRLRDRRAFDALVVQLMHGQASTVRESTARAMGMLGDARAIPYLIRAASHENLPSSGESMLRLGALGRSVGGTDFSPDTPLIHGIAACRRDPYTDDDWGYLNRTQCRTWISRVQIPLAVPPAVRNGPVLVLFRARRADANAPVRVHLTVGDVQSPPFTLDGGWTEQRMRLPSIAPGATAVLETENDARVALDHVLILPQPR